MIGITLTADQIRTAPADVRRWIEREVVTSLGLPTQAPNAQTAIEHLATCSLQELTEMLSLIQGIFPAVNVLFELGRPGVNFAQGKLVAFRLSEILLHTRLQKVEQVISCLEIIDEALHRVRGATEDTEFYGLDSHGHCFITAHTQQNIVRLWNDVIGGTRAAAGNPADISSQEASALPQSVFASPADRPAINDPSQRQTVRPTSGLNIQAIGFGSCGWRHTRLPLETNSRHMMPLHDCIDGATVPITSVMSGAQRRVGFARSPQVGE